MEESGCRASVFLAWVKGLGGVSGYIFWIRLKAGGLTSGGWVYRYWWVEMPRVLVHARGTCGKCAFWSSLGGDHVTAKGSVDG